MEDGFLRIPGSRRKYSKLSKQSREQRWDNRFVLGRIPEYIQPKVKKPTLLGPGRIRKKRDTIGRSASAKVVELGKATTQRSVQLTLDQLHELWEEKRVDSQFRQEFLTAIDKLPLENMAKALNLQLNNVLSNRSPPVICSQAVEKREALISDLRQLENSLDIDRNSVIEGLNALRVHSVHIVENVHAWREQLKNINPRVYKNRRILFFFNGENYLLKMREDTGFLYSSCLAKFFEFASRVDPFLVAASLSRNKKIQLPIAPALLRRIKVCEGVLLDESVSSVIRQSPFELRQKKKYKNVNTGVKQIVDIGAKQVVSIGDKKKYSPKPTEEPLNAIEPQGFTLVEAGDLIKEIEFYAPLVPEIIKNTLGDPLGAYAASLELRYPAYLWVQRNGERLGLLVINLEVQKTLQKRLHVTHFSCLSLELFPEVLPICLDYIWENYPCVEIRIGLISNVNSQGKYETDKTIKQHFDLVGFRWKQMLHSKAEVNPLQSLGLRRPEDKECQNATAARLFDDCISLSYGCVLQVDLNAETSEVKNQELNCMSLLGLACTLRESIEGLDQSQLNPPQLLDLVNKMEAVPPAFRFRKDEDQESALKDLASVNLSVGALGQALETIVSCAALGISWSKFLTGQINGKPYTKVMEAEIPVMVSGQHLVYIVPTEDQLFSTFFIPTQGEINLPFDTARQILGNASEVKEVINEIWIPEIKFKTQRSVDGVVGQPVEEYSLSNCIETIDLQFLSCKHPKGSLNSVPQPGEVVLEPPFLCGIINSKVDEELEIPYLVLNIH